MVEMKEGVWNGVQSEYVRRSMRMSGAYGWGERRSLRMKFKVNGWNVGYASWVDRREERSEMAKLKAWQ